MAHMTKPVRTGFLALLTGLILLIHPQAEAQQTGLQQYIETYRDIAMQEMRRHGIPASIKLAQGILESGFGNSELAVNANNHFGIKCHGWDGPGYLFDDDEPEECFRVYASPQESFLDHSQFLLTRPWYAFLFELDVTDYRAWAEGLSTAGYATDPQYAQRLIRLIETHGLATYDQQALDMIAGQDRSPQYDLEWRAEVQAPLPSDFAPISFAPRTEKQINRVRYIRARPGDTPQSLAREFGLWEWQIRRYNDLHDQQEIQAGQKVFLQRKRRRGNQALHTVEKGESLHDIAQRYAVRINRLYRYNDLGEEGALQEGQQIALQRGLR